MSIELPDHMEDANKGDEADTHDEDDGGCDLEARGIICVES